MWNKKEKETINYKIKVHDFEEKKNHSHRSDGLLNPWNVLSIHSTFHFRRSDHHNLQHEGESIDKINELRKFVRRHQMQIK